MIFRKMIRQGFSQQRLFTPGPLNTTDTVKQSMLIDYGSRDPFFLRKLDNIRSGILDLAGCQSDKYTPILIQGSGTYAIEATLHTCVFQKTDKILVVTNGSYGERQIDILQKQGKQYKHLQFEDYELVNPQKVIDALNDDPQITHVGIVHSETTSGLVNPIDFLKNYSRPIHLIVDAMSSFGAYQMNAQENNIDFLISSSNKCIQAPPGFAFVVANKQALSKYKNNATSLVLDLVDQDENMNKTKQFRFTPPTHVLVAFEQALKEHKQQGGIQGRFNRYDVLQRHLWESMQQLGFRPYLSREAQGCIITTFYEPKHKNYNFKDFYDYLASKNCVIYPGKKTKAPTFRIGSIGELRVEDFELLISLIKEYLQKNHIPIPVPNE